MSAPPSLDNVKALTFDIFGTVFDWRSSLETALTEAVQKKMAAAAAAAAVPADVLSRARELTPQDIVRFAQEFRDDYFAFTEGFVPGVTPWKDIDAYYHDSLVEQLARWQLAGLWSADEVRDLSLTWHRLKPWPDAADGVRRLGVRYVTASLSNGNQSILRDLDVNGGIGFQRILSAADVHAYKPHPSVYLGAAENLGVAPTEVAMVAAHLNDLEGARRAGLRTIYVERPGEEAWAKDDERYTAAKAWVDVWVGQTEDGFREVAKRLGL